MVYSSGTTREENTLDASSFIIANMVCYTVVAATTSYEFVFKYILFTLFNTASSYLTFDFRTDWRYFAQEVSSLQR